MHLNSKKESVTTHSVQIDHSDLVRMLQDAGFDCPHNGVSINVQVAYDEWDLLDCPLIATWTDEVERKDLTS